MKKLAIILLCLVLIVSFSSVAMAKKGKGKGKGQDNETPVTPETPAPPYVQPFRVVNYTLLTVL